MDIFDVGKDSEEEATAVRGDLSLLTVSAGHPDPCPNQAVQPPLWGAGSSQHPAVGWWSGADTQGAHLRAQRHLPRCLLTIRCIRNGRSACKNGEVVTATPTSRDCMCTCPG